MTVLSPEEKLSNPKKTIEMLQRSDFTFLKKLGQNFLVDDLVIRRIVDAAALTPQDCVVEIGPGMGTLTQYLAEAAGKVVAVEIDRMLIPILAQTLSAYHNVRVINADILKTDLSALSLQEHGGKPLKVVANLPYYITTPILMQLLEHDLPLSSITVMVQKEVAARMGAKPGSKDYGALSLAVQYYAKPSVVANVPPNCFIPRPGVDSAVVHLDLTARPPLRVTDEALLFRLIRASFNQRRKTLVNGIKNAGSLPYTKEQVAQVIAEANLSPTVRGETLSLETFVELANRFADI